MRAGGATFVSPALQRGENGFLNFTRSLVGTAYSPTQDSRESDRKNLNKQTLCLGTTSQLAEELLHGHKKCQGTTSQFAEELLHGHKKCQGTTSQLAEELLHGHKKCQGTT
jgi:hypothetical protein